MRRVWHLKSGSRRLRSPRASKNCRIHRYSNLDMAEYQGKKVSLGKPFYTPGETKKRAVYVRNPKGTVIRVRFGDPNMEIKKDDPERRKSFRARHNCDTATDKTTPRHWSCKMW